MNAIRAADDNHRANYNPRAGKRVNAWLFAIPAVITPGVCRPGVAGIVPATLTDRQDVLGGNQLVFAERKATYNACRTATSLLDDLQP
jgi:hypothetical protein